MTNTEIIQKSMSRAELLAQLAEEAAELTQAALKLRRALGNDNPTPVSVGEALERLTEECADTYLCYRLAMSPFPGGEIAVRQEIIEIMERKEKRWVQRLVESSCKSGGDMLKCK